MTAATYDGNGLRACTTITPAGGSAVTQEYVWNAQRIPQLLMDGKTPTSTPPGLRPPSRSTWPQGTITYLVADSLGSVRGTVSSAEP